MNEETKQKSAIKRLRQQIVGVVGWVRDRWRTNPLASVVVVILVVALALITWETGRLGNFGLGEKTYWDWMELLIIPIVLAIGGWLLNKSERESEREIADKRREDDKRIAEDNRNQATLETYFDRMTELLLEKELRESEKGDEVQSIARTRTLAVLRSLDGNRKGQVVQFLCESRLIDFGKPVVKLSKADLRGAYLRETNLSEDDLSEADLRRANLHEADLSRANLIGANLHEADLSRTNLSSTDLHKADLIEANLSWANLSWADLRGANLTGADLSWTYLTGARVTDKQLAQAASLAGATLPDGRRVPDEETAGEQE